VAGTTPYPWPWDGDLTAAATALLVVVQDGADAGCPAVRQRTGALARGLRAAGGRVIAATTRRPARTGPPPRGDDRSWSGLVAPELVDVAVVAQGIDAFYGSDLELLLTAAGTRRLLLAGTPLETCVHSSLRAANDRGLECLLLQDVCVAAEPALVAASVSMVEMSGGIFGAVGTSTAALTAWAPPAPAPTDPACGGQP